MGDPKISDATKHADRADAHKAAEPDRMPAPEEEQRAEDLSVDPDTARSIRQAVERGAKHPGEGRIP